MNAADKYSQQELKHLLKALLTLSENSCQKWPTEPKCCLECSFFFEISLCFEFFIHWLPEMPLNLFIKFHFFVRELRVEQLLPLNLVRELSLQISCLSLVSFLLHLYYLHQHLQLVLRLFQQRPLLFQQPLLQQQHLFKLSFLQVSLPLQIPYL